MTDDDLERIIEKHKSEERNPDIAKQEFVLGETEFKKRNYVKAAKHFNVAYNNNPNKEYLRKKIYSFYIEYIKPLERGKELKKEVDVDEAIKELEIAIGLDSEYDVYHSLLAIFLDGRGRTTEAVGETRKAVRLEPDSALNHNNLAFYLGNISKSEEEIIEYEKAIELDPDNFLYHFNLATILFDKKDYDGALDELDNSIRLKPNHINSYYYLGRVYEKIGRDYEAIKEFREAIRLDPNDAEKHNRLALLLDKKGEKYEAIDEFREAVGLDYNDTIYHNNLAITLREVGKKDEAEEEYRIVIDLDPSNKDAKRSLSCLLSEKGEKKFMAAVKEEFASSRRQFLNDAKDEFEEALRMYDLSISAHVLLGHVLQAGCSECINLHSSMSEAISHYNKAIELDSERNSSKESKTIGYMDYVYIGLGFYNYGNTEKAIFYLRKAKELVATENFSNKKTGKKIKNRIISTLEDVFNSTHPVGRFIRKQEELGLKFNQWLEKKEYISSTNIMFYWQYLKRS